MGKGIEIVLEGNNRKNSKKNKKVINPYGDLYRRRKSFFPFVGKQSSHDAPSEPIERQSSSKSESTQDEINNNTNPWELQSVAKQRSPCEEPATKGRMRFTVKRYDSVPTVETPGRDGDAGSGEKHRNTDALQVGNSSSDNNTHVSSPEPTTPPSPRASPVMPRLQEKTFSDLDFLDSPSMDSFTSTLFSGQAAERDAIAHRGRLFAKSRDQRRLVLKEGGCNISLGNVRKRRRRFMHDIFTTLLELRWRYHLIMFSCVFLITWLFFGAIWYIILLLHKDHQHIEDPEWTPCVVNVYDFVSALLFSIETQHTIGYGSRAMETKCPEAVVLLMVQSCTGVFFQSLMTGIIFAKLSRPKSRATTIRFSKNAVVCQRDGRFCLLFRVADMRKSHIVGAIIRAVMVKNVITKEGEPLPLAQSMLKTEAENGGEDNSIYLLWPTTVIHWIDEDSPFWKMSAEEMLSERFEIVVFLEATVESTGMTTQVRTSYLPTEILWGHRLAPLVTYQKENGQYRVDYTLFHSSIPVPTPECSPMEAAQGTGDHIGIHTPNNIVNRFTHLRNDHRPSVASLVVPSNLTMGAEFMDKRERDRQNKIWRRQSLPKLHTPKSGSAKGSRNSINIGRKRSRSLRNTGINGLAKILPTGGGNKDKSPKGDASDDDNTKQREDRKNVENDTSADFCGLNISEKDEVGCPDIMEAETVA